MDPYLPSQSSSPCLLCIVDEVWELKDCWLEALWFPVLKDQKCHGKEPLESDRCGWSLTAVTLLSLKQALSEPQFTYKAKLRTPFSG